MNAAPSPQELASNPRASVFVAANAGSGKTSTLVKRVARLLLRGDPPETILCVTFTKAGAAEMQRRLFDLLGDWAVMDDAPLETELSAIGEPGRDLSKARALFARALETPGGLKIQTLHAFCEQLLRRFPLEAGVSPGFSVLEDAAAAQVSARARADVAAAALGAPGGPIAEAYNHFSVQLDWRAFNRMFDDFEARRVMIGAYVDACGDLGDDIWRRCGFARPTSSATIEAEAVGRIRWGAWKRAAEAVALGTGKSDETLAAALLATRADSSFTAIRPIFLTQNNTPRKTLGTKSVAAWAREWLAEEQARCLETHERSVAARIAEETSHALTLAIAYGELYEGAKRAMGALDFSDLIGRALTLLTRRADAAWVLYKLDGGLTHILLDEAQDTAPEQWDILRALTGEFFSGAGARPNDRTMFAVGDEKQSIFSFQGADPKRLAAERQTFMRMVEAAGQRFEPVDLRESWRSTQTVLSFVDAVIAIPEVMTGLTPADGDRIVPIRPVRHVAHRDGGCVEIWPLEQGEDSPEVDPWTPVDAEPARSANKLLARRVAVSVAAMTARGDGVWDRDTGALRPCAPGDILILVRRRNVLFHEIIRALKREGVPLAGADRLKLSEHGVFADLEALGRFARFPGDDLALAGLLRSPFCDLNEESLFDLAYGRDGRLWSTLMRRGHERTDWRGAADFLRWALAESADRPPFDFYSRVLSRIDGEGRSMRQRILTRLGAEGEEAMDAFLAEALGAEARGVHDLETFLAGLAAIELEIKREPDEAHARGSGEVRVMTVHGAKGLEAPIVILPDTTTRATAQGGALLQTADGGFVWAPRKPDDNPVAAAARAAREAAAEEESARLLYVAMTRARDRLILCGVETQPHRFERSWYHYARSAFDDLPIHPFSLEGGGEGWRYGADPEALGPGAAPLHDAYPLPPWTRGLAPLEPAASRYASPSDLGAATRDAAPSPLAALGGLGRYRRGNLIHRLLQILPDLAPGARAAAASSLLAREMDLTDEQRREMATATLAVLSDARFAAVFGPGSRAEVALAGAAERLPVDLRISGRVDRLVVEENRVLVVDFKTNRPAPDSIETTDPNYVLQMGIYWAVLAEIFPGRTIEAALVWTDGPRLTPVPEDAMRRALQSIMPA